MFDVWVFLDTETKNEEELPWYRTLTPYKLYVLLILLVTYLLNQLDRYMLAISSKAMAQEIHFGDKACMKNSSVLDSALGGIKCEKLTSEYRYEGTDDGTYMYIDWVFTCSSPELKAQVSLSDHLLSVVCPSVNFSHFHLLLKNHLQAQFQPNLPQSILG